jgi:hypothetical protein
MFERRGTGIEINEHNNELLIGHLFFVLKRRKK